MMRAARLQAALYEEVEADPTAMTQAATVVILSSIAAGIPELPTTGIRGLALAAALTFVGWYVWAALTWFIGTRVLPAPQTRADIGELLRTLGFSSAPGVIRVLGVVPGARVAVEAVAAAWMLASMIVAVRQALDYSGTGRAIAVCAIGFAVQFLLGALFLWPMHAQ